MSNVPIKVLFPKDIWKDMYVTWQQNIIEHFSALMSNMKKWDLSEIPLKPKLNGMGLTDMLVSSAIKLESPDVICEAPVPDKGWKQNQRIIYAISQDRKTLLAFQYFPQHSGKYEVPYHNRKDDASADLAKEKASNPYSYFDSDNIIDISQIIEEEIKANQVADILFERKDPNLVAQQKGWISDFYDLYKETNEEKLKELSDFVKTDVDFCFMTKSDLEEYLDPTKYEASSKMAILAQDKDFTKFLLATRKQLDEENNTEEKSSQNEINTKLIAKIKGSTNGIV